MGMLKGYKTFFLGAFVALSMVFSTVDFAWSANNFAPQYGTTNPPSALYREPDAAQSANIVEFKLNYKGGDVLGCSGLNMQDLVGFNLNTNDLPQKFGDYLKSSFTTELLARAMTHPLLATVFESADNFGSVRADYLTAQCNAATVGDRSNELRAEALALCTRNRMRDEGENYTVANAECSQDPRFQQQALDDYRAEFPPVTFLAQIQNSAKDAMKCFGRDCEGIAEAMMLTIPDRTPDGQSTQAPTDVKSFETAIVNGAERVGLGSAARSAGGGNSSGSGSSGSGGAAATGLKAGAVNGPSEVAKVWSSAKMKYIHSLALRIQRKRADEARQARLESNYEPVRQTAFVFQPSGNPFLADVKLNVMGFAQGVPVVNPDDITGGGSQEAIDTELNRRSLLAEASALILPADHPFLRFIGCIDPDYTRSFVEFNEALAAAVEADGSAGGVDVVQMLNGTLQTLKEAREGALVEGKYLSGLIQPNAEGDTPYQTSVYQDMVTFGIPQMQKMVASGMGCVFNDRMGMPADIFWRMAQNGVSLEESAAVWAASSNELAFQVTELILRFMKHQMLNIYATIAYDVGTAPEEEMETVANTSMVSQTDMYETHDVSNTSDTGDRREIQNVEFVLEAVKITSDMFENQISALRTAHDARVNFAKVLLTVEQRLREISEN